MTPTVITHQYVQAKCLVTEFTALTIEFAAASALPSFCMFKIQLPSEHLQTQHDIRYFEHDIPPQLELNIFQKASREQALFCKKTKLVTMLLAQYKLQ